MHHSSLLNGGKNEEKTDRAGGHAEQTACFHQYMCTSSRGFEAEKAPHSQHGAPNEKNGVCK